MAYKIVSLVIIVINDGYVSGISNNYSEEDWNKTSIGIALYLIFEVPIRLHGHKAHRGTSMVSI